MFSYEIETTLKNFLHAQFLVKVGKQELQGTVDKSRSPCYLGGA